MLLRLGVCFDLRVCFETSILTRLIKALSLAGSFLSAHRTSLQVSGLKTKALCRQVNQKILIVCLVLSLVLSRLPIFRMTCQQASLLWSFDLQRSLRP